jgi:hypothetical protein
MDVWKFWTSAHPRFRRDFTVVEQKMTELTSGAVNHQVQAKPATFLVLADPAQPAKPTHWL